MQRDDGIPVIVAAAFIELNFGLIGCAAAPTDDKLFSLVLLHRHFRCLKRVFSDVHAAGESD